MDFTGKVVLKTGASSGIGAVTARHFAKKGADLSLAGRDEAALSEVAKECSSFNCRQAMITIGDLSDYDHLHDLVQSTVANYGRLDVLVNNAGFLDLGSVESQDIGEQYDRASCVNVKPALVLTALVLPHLEKTKGNIVNVSSIAGLRPFPGLLVYCMSKSSMDQMTRCTALELAPKHIRVNSVKPGTIPTQLQKRAGMNDEAITRYLDGAKKAHALGRAGTPEEVASVISFLASDAASFVTGVSIPVDGGRHCMTPASF